MSERVRRAYVPSGARPGATVALDPDEAHHVARVLRLRAGDTLAVFDGLGGEWLATVAASGRDGVTVCVGDARPGDPEPPLSVTLWQASVRPEKLEWVLQKGTELGVSSFRIVTTGRVEAPEPSASRLDRYRRIVLEACKQSGRRRVPALACDRLGDPPPGTTAIVLDARGGVPALGALLEGPPTPEVWVAVGPEGGFTDAEIEDLSARGWRRASLGPRVLRTETAGAVAAALVLFAWGDLGHAPSRAGSGSSV